MNEIRINDKITMRINLAEDSKKYTETIMDT